MDNVLKKKPVNMEDMQAYTRILSNLGIVSEGVCSTAAATAAKTVTLGATFSLENKATILVTFTNGISVANSTLAITHTNIAGTEITETAKPIYLNGAALEANVIPEGARIILRYNGTQFDVIGGAGGRTYTNGDGINIINNEISVKAGTNLSINQDGVLSAANEVQIGGETPSLSSDVEIFIDTTEDATAEVYTKQQQDGKFIVIKDLSTAPTESTLTYTENGTVKNFKQGDEVRVPDQNADNGYTFYKLYELTTSGNTTTATWDKLDAEEIVQTTGNSTTAVMSQKAVSDELDGKLSLDGTDTITGMITIDSNTTVSEQDTRKQAIATTGAASFGQNTNGTATIDAYNGLGIYGADCWDENGDLRNGGYISMYRYQKNTGYHGGVGINMFPPQDYEGVYAKNEFYLMKTTNDGPYIELRADDEGGNIKISSKNRTYSYEFDAYADYFLRLVVFGPNSLVDTHINFNFDGSISATGFNSNSDIRKKNVLEDVNLSVNDIANAPLFKFTWLDPQVDQTVNVGTSAQYWRTILPELTTEGKDEEKTLSMQYGVAALASSVALAKKVVEQEETIKAQEARIKALEDAIADIQNKLNN